MKIALLQNHTGHYYRIQHLINTFKLNNDVIEISNINDLEKDTFDILLIEYYSAYSKDPHTEMCSRINLLKDNFLKFRGKIIFYSVDDGQATYIREMDLEVANRLDAWFVFMKNEGYLNDNQDVKKILNNKFVLIPRFTLPYINTDDIVYENKQNKIVFIGRTTGNYWFQQGKNWRVECLQQIWDHPFLKNYFDGWLIDDEIIDVSYQNYEYNKTFKFVKKNYYLSENEWMTKLKNSTLSLCIPGHTKYGYRHPQSMICKSTMLANFDLENDPYTWLFSDKLKNISYTVKNDLSNFVNVCEEAVLNTEKTKEYAYAAYEIYKIYFEPTATNTYQNHVWSLVKLKLEYLNIINV